MTQACGTHIPDRSVQGEGEPWPRPATVSIRIVCKSSQLLAQGAVSPNKKKRKTMNASCMPFASLGARRTNGHCRLVRDFPFFQSASSAGKIDQRHLRERWQGCGKMGKMGNLSQIVSFFSDFSPITYKFHTFFLHFPLGIFWHFLTFPHLPPFSPISLHFSPFPSISPQFPSFPPIFLHVSIFPIFLCLCG